MDRPLDLFPGNGTELFDHLFVGVLQWNRASDKAGLYRQFAGDGSQTLWGCSCGLTAIPSRPEGLSAYSSFFAPFC